MERAPSPLYSCHCWREAVGEAIGGSGARIPPGSVAEQKLGAPSTGSIGTRTVARAVSRARIRKDGSWNASCGSPHFVGIDVSKDRLDVYVVRHVRSSLLREMAKPLRNSSLICVAWLPPLIVLEATGGFEITVAAALASAGPPLAVVNPRQIRDFARATGRLAKTDALYAQIIALFAERASFSISAASVRSPFMASPSAPL